MADNFNAKAVIEAQIEGIKSVLDDLNKLEGNLIGVGEVGERASKLLAPLKKALKDIGDSSKGIDSSGKSAKGAAAGWDKYAKSVREAEAAQKKLAAEQAKVSSSIDTRIANTRSAPDQAYLSSVKVDLGNTGDLSAARASLEEYDAAVRNLADKSMPSLRYAMYDASRTAAVLSAALITGLTGVVVASAKFESAFTSVERTSGVAGTSAAALRDELISLTRDMPVSFEDIAGIATLGAQLNIAADQLDDFASVTARFSATAGVSTDAAAEGFGRIKQLVGDDSLAFENLASAILLTGNTSVATEQDVLNYAQRLSVAGAEAGFAADEIVALAATTASLGIGLEAAQGATQRIFQQISRDVSDGGDALEAYARISKTSAADFASDWASAPQKAFSALIGGLSEVKNLTGALDSLGIVETREVRLMTALANNTEFYNEQLATSNKAMREGTYLSESYGMVVDDLASRWQIFLNSLMEAGATIGDALAPVFGGVLEGVTKVIQGFTALADHPVGQAFIGVVGTMTAVVAVLGLIVAGGAAAAGSLLAVRFALREIGFLSATATTGFKGFASAMLGVQAATGGAATAVKIFKGALVSTGIGAIAVLLGSLAAGFMDAGGAAGGFNVDFSGLGAAMAKDTQAMADGAKAVRLFASELPAQSDEQDKTAQSAEGLRVILDEVADSAEGASEASKQSALAWGESAQEYAKAQLRMSDAFNGEDGSLNADSQFVKYWQVIGADIDEAIEAAAINGEQGVRDYFARLEKVANVERSSGVPLLYPALTLGDGFAVDTAQIDKLIETLGEVEGQAQAAANSVDIFGDGASAAAGDIDEFGSSAIDTANDLLAAENAALSMENSLYRLGASLGENAGMWDIFSEGGRSNLGALYAVLEAMAAETPGNTQAIAANFQALYNTLIQGGYATAQQLEFLRLKIADLSGGSVVKAAPRNFASMFNGIGVGAAKAAKSVQKAAKQIKKEFRSLVDYANDLAGVMQRAFDIRFSAEQNFDEITSGWHDIANAAAEAREAAEEHRRTLASMGADRAIKQYWLSVAENYGDELRAGKLRAELAEIDADMAAEKKELTKAQDESSMSLIGNSQAAVDNRGNLADLVKNYQEYLKALAASGASQDELRAKAAQLRAEFVAQATAMGFNRNEVEKYASAFDDMSYIIEEVPRNVTVDTDANTTPAQLALREFKTKADIELYNAGLSGTNNFNAGSSGLASGLISNLEATKGPIGGYTGWFMEQWMRATGATGFALEGFTKTVSEETKAAVWDLVQRGLSFEEAWDKVMDEAGKDGHRFAADQNKSFDEVSAGAKGTVTTVGGIFLDLFTQNEKNAATSASRTRGHFGGMVDGVRDAADGFGTASSDLLDQIDRDAAASSSLTQGHFNNIATGALGAATTAAGVFANLFTQNEQGAAASASRTQGHFGGMANGIAGASRTAASEVSTAWWNAGSQMSSGANSASSSAASAWGSAMMSATSSVNGTTNSILNSWNNTMNNAILANNQTTWTVADTWNAVLVGISRAYNSTMNSMSKSTPRGSAPGRYAAFSSGGYTGNYGVTEEVGFVHGKEFVFSAAATRNIGVNNLAYAHKQAQQGLPFSLGNGGGAGGVVTLSASSVQAIARAMLNASPSVVLPGAQLASSTGETNKVNTSIGAA